MNFTKLVCKSLVNNNSSLVQIKAWHWAGDKAIIWPNVNQKSMTSYGVTWQQWVKKLISYVLLMRRICGFVSKLLFLIQSSSVKTHKKRSDDMVNFYPRPLWMKGIVVVSAIRLSALQYNCPTGHDISWTCFKFKTPITPNISQKPVDFHYSDVIMSVVTSQITSISRIVYSTVCSGADQRKHQSSMLLPLWGEFTGDL